MTTFSESPTMMVAMREATVASLMALHTAPDECIADIVDRLLPATKPATLALPKVDEAPDVSSARAGKHACDLLGTRLYASSLGAIFGEVIDLMDTIAPEAVVLLSDASTGQRRHVSREKTGVHLHRPDLPVLQTKSGWWISMNISKPQTKAHFRALCKAAGIKFGKDLRFPSVP